MSLEKWFEEVHLHVTELPVEWENGKPIYAGLIKELPQIFGRGNSRQEMMRQLAEEYHEYWRLHQPTEENEEMTSTLLSADELLKYYDGETFDGFQLPF